MWSKIKINTPITPPPNRRTMKRPLLVLTQYINFHKTSTLIFYTMSIHVYTAQGNLMRKKKWSWELSKLGGYGECWRMEMEQKWVKIQSYFFMYFLKNKQDYSKNPDCDTDTGVGVLWQSSYTKAPENQCSPPLCIWIVAGRPALWVLNLGISTLAY